MTTRIIASISFLHIPSISLGYRSLQSILWKKGAEESGPFNRFVSGRFVGPGKSFGRKQNSWLVLNTVLWGSCHFPRYLKPKRSHSILDRSASHAYWAPILDWRDGAHSDMTPAYKEFMLFNHSKDHRSRRWELGRWGMINHYVPVTPVF